MASTGSRVLLVDADLRKGVLHNHFGAPADRVNRGVVAGLDWTEALTAQGSQISSCFLGSRYHKSSEFFISEVTEKFLKRLHLNLIMSSWIRRR